MIQDKMTLGEFKKWNTFFIDNIQDGFSQYSNILIEGTVEQVNNQIKQLIKLNGMEHSFGDCYYGKLDEEARGKIKEVLTEQEIQCLEDLELGEEELYVRLNPELLEVLLKLTATEMLFSSFYFTKYPCIVWGNYGRKYPIFCLNRWDLDRISLEILGGNNSEPD